MMGMLQEQLEAEIKQIEESVRNNDAVTRSVSAIVTRTEGEQ